MKNKSYGIVLSDPRERYYDIDTSYCENYKSKEFYEAHKIIDFITLEEKEKYEIFAVFKTVAYNQNAFKYYTFRKFEFAYFFINIKDK